MMKSTLQDWIARQCFEYQNQCVKDPVIMDQSSGLPDANFTSSLPNIPDGLQPTVEVTQQDPNFDTTTSWPFQHVTDSLPRITPGQPVAEGTTNILSHVRPVGSVGAPSISRGNESRTADDGVVLAAAVSPPVINPAVNVPVRDGPPSSDHSTGFFGSLHKPISIKTLPEKSKHRVKNYAGDTHPLARKFLLLIGTIAFLAGIN
ncbi:hypothetical protein RvY_05359 [Ramazzottius varieornatus]|uniref:Uncharacterized protein n=1 Tax=Ramazzottius varieornatus TaxID=947166 RepID=A0A1D1V0E6_RAMVA|nr:hypothetical protein RvY_05359 [Ramazzottius varieornatus]